MARSMITRLTRRYERQPLATPNVAYFLWRFVANGIRTFRALATRHSFRDTKVIPRELSTDVIVVGPSFRFLSDEGQTALTKSAAEIVAKSRSQKIQAILSGDTPAKGVKEFRIDLLS